MVQVISVFDVRYENNNVIGCILAYFETSYVVLFVLNGEAINFHRFFCIRNKLLLLLLGLQGPGVFLMASDLHTYRKVCMLLAIGF